jgi:ACT domain-containing protein
MSIKAVVSVLGKDQTGIVAKVATALYESDANIDDISQSLLEDVFSMTMIVSINDKTSSFNAVQERLAAAAEGLGVQIVLQRHDVFEFMYKV